MFKLYFLLLVFSLHSNMILARHADFCGRGWLTYKGSSECYRVGFKPTTKWNDARRACLWIGGDLVKITSARENRYVASLARTYSSSNSFMWMGLVGDSSNEFSWVDGTSLSSQKYTNWNSGEPNNYNGQAEDCGMVYLKNMKWNDAVCNHDVAMIYVCLSYIVFVCVSA